MPRSAWRLSAALVVALSALGGSVLGAGPASATACPSSYTCTWDGFHYQGNGNTGHYIKFQRYIPDLRSFAYAGTSTSGNDTASSISNNGVSQPSYAFKDLNCNGYGFGLPRGTGDGNLSDSSGRVPLGASLGFNNSITSAAFSGYVNACRNA